LIAAPHKKESDAGKPVGRRQLLTTPLMTKAKENHVMAAPARVETIPYLAATQVAQEPRRQELTADMLDDLWRSACEMPDAPHLSKR
jgi:hypothetical protein